MRVRLAHVDRRVGIGRSFCVALIARRIRQASRHRHAVADVRLARVPIVVARDAGARLDRVGEDRVAIRRRRQRAIAIGIAVARRAIGRAGEDLAFRRLAGSRQRVVAKVARHALREVRPLRERDFREVELAARTHDHVRSARAVDRVAVGIDGLAVDARQVRAGVDLVDHRLERDRQAQRLAGDRIGVVEVFCAIRVAQHAHRDAVAVLAVRAQRRVAVLAVLVRDQLRPRQRRRRAKQHVLRRARRVAEHIRADRDVTTHGDAERVGARWHVLASERARVVRDRVGLVDLVGHHSRDRIGERERPRAIDVLLRVVGEVGVALDQLVVGRRASEQQLLQRPTRRRNRLPSG